jgi:hypothetical protein
MVKMGVGVQMTVSLTEITKEDVLDGLLKVTTPEMRAAATTLSASLSKERGTTSSLPPSPSPSSSPFLSSSHSSTKGQVEVCDRILAKLENKLGYIPPPRRHPSTR